MKTLDALLFQWVGEADESRAEIAFRAYYSTAFPALARHVQYRTGWDPATAEDIAQEALLRFFERTGRGRREAIALVISTASRLADAGRGVPHSREIARWASEVETFANYIAALRLPSDTHSSAAAMDVWTRIVSLQKTGWHLINDLKRKLQCNSRECDEPEDDSLAVFPTAVEQMDAADLSVGDIRAFVAKLVHEHSHDASGAVLTEHLQPGIGRLAESVLVLIDTLPRVRLPTNGFLFDIATTLFLDEIKRRRRKKRGGEQGLAPAREAAQSCADDMSPFAVDIVRDEPRTDLEHGIWLDRCPAPLGPTCSATDTAPLAADPAVRFESEQFLLRFYEFLRSPVARAVRALEEARAQGCALAERDSLERVSRKFSRTMAVLSMMGEGYTQEETARLAGLSRNQVKYVVESVKEAYARFSADETRVPFPRIDPEGVSHVF